MPAAMGRTEPLFAQRHRLCPQIAITLVSGVRSLQIEIVSEVTRFEVPVISDLFVTVFVL